MYTPSFVKIPNGGLKIPKKLVELTWNDPDNINGKYICIKWKRGNRAKQLDVDPRKAKQEIGQIELLSSPIQMLWRDEKTVINIICYQHEINHYQHHRDCNESQ